MANYKAMIFVVTSSNIYDVPDNKLSSDCDILYTYADTVCSIGFILVLVFLFLTSR